MFVESTRNLVKCRGSQLTFISPWIKIKLFFVKLISSNFISQFPKIF